MKTQTPPQTAAPTRVTVAARDLRQVLAGLGKVMGKHPPISALGCIRIVADGSGDAELAATDCESSAYVRLKGVADGGQAEFLVPFARLHELLKPASPGDPVTLSPSPDGEGAEVGCGARSRKVAAPPASAFPRPPQFAGEAHALPANAIRAIGEALQCVSTDKTRGVVNGVCLDTAGSSSGHHIVGTDGRHLYSANSFRLPLAAPAILAPHRLLPWKPVRDAGGWTLRTARDKDGRGGSYELTAGAWRLVGRLVDGDYPAWRQVVPRDGDLGSCVRYAPGGIAEIASTVARLPIATAGNHHPVVVRSDGARVELLWKEAPDEPYQAIPIRGASASGKPFAITIDRGYLAKAFAFGLGEMRVGDETDPALFGDGEGRQMVVMPLRMHGALPPQRPGGEPPRAGAEKQAAPRPAPKPGSKPRPEPQPKQQPRPEPEPKPRPAPDMTDMTDKRDNRKPPAPASGAPLDEALQDLSKLRDTLRETAAGLQATAGKLKQARQEQRGADKEMRSVRSTLDSLRKVRL